MLHEYLITGTEVLWHFTVYKALSICYLKLWEVGDISTLKMSYMRVRVVGNLTDSSIYDDRTS